MNYPVTIKGIPIVMLDRLYDEFCSAPPYQKVNFEFEGRMYRTWASSIRKAKQALVDYQNNQRKIGKDAALAYAYGMSPAMAAGSHLHRWIEEAQKRINESFFVPARLQGKSERARAVEEAMQMMQTIEPGAVWRHIDWAVVDKALEDTMTTKADVAAEAEKPTNRAEQVLLTDLNARRRDRDYQRAKQKEHADIAKGYKMQADKHAVAVKEVEASMKKSGFDIPEDAGK